MRDRAAIDFACNDPDNGLFAGKVCSAAFGDAELESPKDFTFTEVSGGFRLHRRIFVVVGGTEWLGNWCWNRYVLPREEMKRQLLIMRAQGWHCSEGSSSFYQWFNRGACR